MSESDFSEDIPFLDPWEMYKVNRVFLVGKVLSEPKKEKLSGTKFTLSLTLKTAFRTKHRYGTAEISEWHRVVAQDDMGELASEQISRDDTVLIIGRLSRLNDTQGDGKFTSVVLMDDFLVYDDEAENEFENVENLVSKLRFHQTPVFHVHRWEPETKTVSSYHWKPELSHPKDHLARLINISSNGNLFEVRDAETKRLIFVKREKWNEVRSGSISNASGPLKHDRPTANQAYSASYGREIASRIMETSIDFGEGFSKLYGEKYADSEVTPFIGFSFCLYASSYIAFAKNKSPEVFSKLVPAELHRQFISSFKTNIEINEFIEILEEASEVFVQEISGYIEAIQCGDIEASDRYVVDLGRKVFHRAFRKDFPNSILGNSLLSGFVVKFFGQAKTEMSTH